jgi:hypothetical protein
LKIMQLSNAMAIIQQGPTQLRALDTMGAPPDQVATARSQVVKETGEAITTVLADAEGPHEAAMRAEALSARGDLNWALASIRPLRGATTNPSLKLPRSEEEYLKAAEDAYSEVIKRYPSQPTAWVTAQLGLAAIAEDRRDWDKAKQIYAEVAAKQDIADVYRTQATLRMNNVLPQIKNPVLIGTYGAAATAPTTSPAGGLGGASPVGPDAFSLTPTAPPPSTQPLTPVNIRSQPVPTTAPTTAPTRP